VWVIMNYNALNQGGQRVVGSKEVSLLPRGGFGREELLPRGLKYRRAEPSPSGV